MNEYQILTDLPTLDAVEDEYVLTGTASASSPEKITVEILPMTVQIGKLNGQPYYRMCDVEIEDDAVIELFKYDFDTIQSSLQHSLLFEDINELSPDEANESYLEDVDEAFEQPIQAWEEEGVSVDDEELQKLYTYIHRQFLQFEWLTAPINDPTVDKISVSTSNGLQVYRDGTEYATSIEFDTEDAQSMLRKTIIFLGQRLGQHISAADPTVEVEDVDDGFPRTLESGFLQLAGQEDEREAKIELVF